MGVRRGGTVSFKYEWERCPEDKDEECEYVVVDVSANVSPYYPAVMYLRNGDPGYPAEGGEIEDLEVRLPSGEILDPIPDELHELLCTRAAEENIE